MIDKALWQDRRVFLTGHTGFKGSWLALLLHRLGASVTGYALEPESDRGLFVLAGVGSKVRTVIGDTRNLDSLTECVREARPEIVFHLAAQPIVRRSYIDPVATYAVNVMGTVNLLEAVRRTTSVRAIVVVTSDKCYQNREWDRPYRENDELGGRDPYSSSKACTELVASAYRSSFFKADIGLATVRAGNVIGGGDWAEDRIVPDLVRGALTGSGTTVRNPTAIRPWQHVLEPLTEYVTVGEHLLRGDRNLPPALNFGPEVENAKSVAALADLFCRIWGNGASWHHLADAAVHEDIELRLDSSLARASLGWRPKWNFEGALEATVAWYRTMADGKDPTAVTYSQIDHYLGESPATT